MSTPSLDQRFAEAIGQLLGPKFPSEIALAVSGGGDSMAMLALAHNWTRSWGVALHVVTVDHGLRVESADEARMVADEAHALGWPHTTLTWNWDGTGNLQDAARRARLSLIGSWRGRIKHVLMAHTADDVAETFLMRLSRGSGVDGLAAMQGKRNTDQGFFVVRPCLDMSRAELRHYLKALNVPWAEDPSNEDPKYDRVKIRQAMTDLEALGIGRDGLVATARRMARAGEALQARLQAAAHACVRPGYPGMVALNRAAFAEVERETALRLLAAAVMWVGGTAYRPRAASLERIADTLSSGGAGTLNGAQAETTKDAIFLYRELAALGEVETRPGRGARWDGRWEIRGPMSRGLTVRAVGEALKHCPDWRATGLPRAALMASPGVFAGAELIAAPIAGHNTAWSAQIVTPFSTFIVSH